MSGFRGQGGGTAVITDRATKYEQIAVQREPRAHVYEPTGSQDKAVDFAGQAFGAMMNQIREKAEQARRVEQEISRVMEDKVAPKVTAARDTVAKKADDFFSRQKEGSQKEAGERMVAKQAPAATPAAKPAVKDEDALSQTIARNQRVDPVNDPFFEGKHLPQDQNTRMKVETMTPQVRAELDQRLEQLRGGKPSPAATQVAAMRPIGSPAAEKLQPHEDPFGQGPLHKQDPNIRSVKVEPMTPDARAALDQRLASLNPGNQPVQTAKAATAAQKVQAPAQVAGSTIREKVEPLTPSVRDQMNQRLAQLGAKAPGFQVAAKEGREDVAREKLTGEASRKVLAPKPAADERVAERSKTAQADAAKETVKLAQAQSAPNLTQGDDPFMRLQAVNARLQGEMLNPAPIPVSDPGDRKAFAMLQEVSQAFIQEEKQREADQRAASPAMSAADARKAEMHAMLNPKPIDVNDPGDAKARTKLQAAAADMKAQEEAQKLANAEEAKAQREASVAKAAVVGGAAVAATSVAKAADKSEAAKPAVETVAKAEVKKPGAEVVAQAGKQHSMLNPKPLMSEQEMRRGDERAITQMGGKTPKPADTQVARGPAINTGDLHRLSFQTKDGSKLTVPTPPGLKAELGYMNTRFKGKEVTVLDHETRVNLAQAIGKQYGVPPKLLYATAGAESQWVARDGSANGKPSQKSVGITQLEFPSARAYLKMPGASEAKLREVLDHPVNAMVATARYHADHNGYVNRKIKETGLPNTDDNRMKFYSAAYNTGTKTRNEFNGDHSSITDIDARRTNSNHYRNLMDHGREYDRLVAQGFGQKSAQTARQEAANPALVQRVVARINETHGNAKPLAPAAAPTTSSPVMKVNQTNQSIQQSTQKDSGEPNRQSVMFGKPPTEAAASQKQPTVVDDFLNRDARFMRVVNQSRPGGEQADSLRQAIFRERNGGEQQTDLNQSLQQMLRQSQRG